MVGFLGIESTMLAAYEAKSRTEIRWPSRCLHWVVATLYFFCTLGITLTVSWRNPKLPIPFGHTPPETHPAQRHVMRDAHDPPHTTSPTILAIYGFLPGMASVINGFIIFSVISAGNSSLYYASRALWGLTYGLEGNSSISKRLRGLSVLMDRTGSPARAIIFTWIAFSWIPFLTLVSFKANDVRVFRVYYLRLLPRSLTINP
jgi:yeast amino acid transporter